MAHDVDSPYRCGIAHLRVFRGASRFFRDVHGGGGAVGGGNSGRAARCADDNPCDWRTGDGAA